MKVSSCARSPRTRLTTIIAVVLSTFWVQIVVSHSIRMSDECDAYVDDDQDIRVALDALERINEADDDYHVCFRGDGLVLRNKIELDSRHNIPGKRVVWRGVTNGDGPFVVDDLVPLQKWYRCNDGTHCPSEDWNEVWVHYVSDIPNITDAMLPVRNMWVNGTRATRISTLGDDLGWTVTATGFTASTTVTPTYVSNEVELLWPRSIFNWIEPRCIVTNVSGHNITVDPLCWNRIVQKIKGTPPVPTFVENIVGPPPPGQFAATKDYIFFRPLSTEPYEVPTNVMVPTQRQLLHASGIVNHTFENIVFRGSTWRMPSSPGGYVPSQTAVTANGEPHGAVAFEGVRDLVIRQCVFEHIGAPYALSVHNRSQHVRVTRNTMNDLSGGAVKLGNVLNETRALSTDSSDWDTNFVVDHNVMTNVAVEYKGASAVFAGYVAHTNISQNSIRGTGYTAISLGWGWGTHVEGPQTFASDNHVVGNRIEQVCSSLNDCGCVYTLGPQPHSTVTMNYCSADSAPVVGCFYHDNGSRFFTTRKNVCTSSPAPCCYLQGCCNAPALDCHVMDLWCRDVAPVQNGCENENCTIDDATLYYLPRGAPWPSEARAIIDSSGAAEAH